MSNTIEAKEIDGELWIKADHHHRTVGEIEAEWRRRCDVVKQEASYWHRRHDAVMDAVMKSTLLHANPPITLMAEPQSYEAGRIKGAQEEREAMVAEAAKRGWAMKNEDPFEDAVREIAAIRARGQA